MKKNNYVLLLIILLSWVFFFPALKTFFSGDDFYILSISQVDSLTKVAHFFSFNQPERNFLFYRPLPAQFFFFLFYRLFKLNPLPYHLFGFLVFGLIVKLVYKLTQKITQNDKTALITTVIYAFSASNLTRLSWITQTQELIFGLTFLLSLWLFLKQKYFWSFLSFVLCLASKEAAIILPIMILITSWFLNRKSKIKIKKLMPFFILLPIYLYLRIFIMGFSIENHYFTSFSLKTVFNTIFWYGLWGLSLPELLVDYVGSGLTVNPKLFNLYGQYIWPIFSLLGLFIMLTGSILIIKFKKIQNPRFFLLSFIWFLFNLGPHLFSPFHKFSYSLTVPLFGLSLFLGLILTRAKPFLLGLSLMTYLLLSLITNLLTLKTHWSFKRGEVAREVINHIDQQNYQETNFYFYNDQPAANSIWGVSQQINHALSGSSGLQVFYQNSTVRVFYEDEQTPPNNVKIVKLPASQFLH